MAFSHRHPKNKILNIWIEKDIDSSNNDLLTMILNKRNPYLMIFELLDPNKTNHSAD